MVYPVPTDDMTAAWYAAAPPPPPLPSKGVQQPQHEPHRASYRQPTASAQPRHNSNPSPYGHAAGSMRVSSSNTSLSFDKRALGDDLPSDSHAPEPERPVSRNAMARQRERQRQRARTNSTAELSPEDYQQAQMRPPSRAQDAATHMRRDSSPAASGQWSTYGYAPPPHQPQAQPYYANSPQVVSPMQYQEPMSYMPVQSPQQPPILQSHPAYAPQADPMQGAPHAYPMVHPTKVANPAYHDYHQASNVEIVGGDLRFAHGAQPQPIPEYMMQAQSGVHQHPQMYVQAGQEHQYIPHSHIAVQSGPAQPVTMNGAIMPPTPAAVPFPSSSMPPPPAPLTGYHGAAPPAAAAPLPPLNTHGTPQYQHAASGRPLPPTSSRTSSQSSSVGTRASTSSFGSMSGSVRRSLPQPPVPGAHPTRQAHDAASQSAHSHATIRPREVAANLSRHESVRSAAEEIMARGVPRRKQQSGSYSRATGSSHANASRSDGSITEGSPTAFVQPQHGPPPSVQRGRAESSGCLEREMRAMKLQEQDGQGRSPNASDRVPLGAVQPNALNDATVPYTPFVAVPPSPISQTPMRAASPRPIRAAPQPAPEIPLDSGNFTVDDALPRRPVSRGPKDDNERRKSMDVSSSRVTSRAEVQVPQISIAPVIAPVQSPPPNVQPPIPAISFSHDEPTSTAAGGPSVPGISISEDAAERHAMPAIQVSGPQIVVDEDGAGNAEEPTGTISISMSSNNLAQRSTTSNATSSPLSSASRPARSTFALPEPASAPSVGSGATCATCQKWIGGRVVHAMSHTFHPDCFACSHCGEHLEHVAFYEHEGRPYCHFDFHELFSKRCFHCRTPIVDQRYITINDKELVGNGSDGQGGTVQERCYHETHFFCANCGDPFLDPKMAASAAGGADTITMDQIEDENGRIRYGGREFVVHKGYPYCEKCHVNLHKPRCKGCKRPIVDEEFLTALRAKWHVGCFCCERCKCAIDSDNFFVRDGQAYDEQCYRIKLRSEL